MASTFSTNLKIELQTTGENSGTWGTITNTNLGTALEQAIVGYGNPSYSSDANLTLTYTDTNAAQTARALVLNATSSVSLTATRELVVPTIQKQYIVQNNTTGSQSITVKTSAGTGITVPNGRKAHLYVDGTNVIYMDDYVDINGGTIDGTPIGATSKSTGEFTTLSASSTATFNQNNANTSLAPTGTGTVTINPATAGTINNMAIGGTTAASGKFSALTNSALTSGRVIYSTTGGLETDSANLTFDGTTLTANALTLTNKLTIANGGTNATATPTAGAVAYGTGTAYAFNTAGTSGQALLSGGAGAPTFGTLGVGAGGTGQTTYTDGQLLIGNSTGNTLTKATLTAGSGVSITNGSGTITIAATGSGGTVTSVAQTFTGGLISVSGSPITGSGTLALTVAGTSGGIPYFSGASTWASSAALTANAIMIGGGAGVAPSTTTTGSGVLTALGNAANATGGFATINGTATLTNKRIDPRVTSAASASTLTPDISAADQYAYTALAANLTINAPTGTPVDGDKLIFRLLDNGTSRTLTWNATYTVIGVTLPTATTASKTTYVGCIYNANNTRWDVIAVTTQA